MVQFIRIRASVGVVYLGSGFGPYWIGYLKDVTGSFRGGLVSVALLLFLAGLTVLRVDRKSTNAS